jgi:hypothetical protein
LKWLHRQIMLSATWQQSGQGDALLEAADPDNRLLGRMTRRRLEIEPWRDAILSVSGSLDRRAGGAPSELADPGHSRRTLYGTVTRRDLADVLRLFDFPDPTAHSPGRIDTTTPLQQLYVLNSDFLGRQAAALAARLERERPGDPAAQVDRAYRLLYGRPAAGREIELALEFLAGGPDGVPTPQRWQAYAEVLLAGNELLYID